jgi:hypothetical protein
MLSSIHKKNKDRYRIRFCDNDFYLNHQNTFKLWKTRFAPLSDVEKLQAWVVALCCLRRPLDWYAGPNATAVFDSSFKHSLTLAEVFAGTPIRLPPKLSIDLNLFDFVNHHRIKAVPESCFRSLRLMTNGTYPLLIRSDVVAPAELLDLQLQKKRIAAFNDDFEKWPTTLYAGRDHLGFMLHDLIHADHFFGSPQDRDGQLGFFTFAKNILSDRQLQRLMQIEKFKEGFEYIISDMNAHPLHLFQTLHSFLSQVVPEANEASQIWQGWLGCNDLTSNDHAALSAVNTRAFTLENAQQIQDYCQIIGRKL